MHKICINIKIFIRIILAVCFLHKFLSIFSRNVSSKRKNYEKDEFRDLCYYDFIV